MPDHSRVRRAPILLVLAGALVAGGLVDRASAAHGRSSASADLVQPVPVAAPADALSSSWFCAGGSDGSGSGGTATPGAIVVANGGPRPVTANVTLVGAATSGSALPARPGPPSVKTLTIAPYSSAAVPESVQGAAWSGALVDADGGSVGVTQVVDGPFGRASSPCSTSGSQHWYLPAGQTRINASETILLLNPYPTASIVDLSFSTDQGVETPQAFESLDVPPSGLVAVPLGSHLRRRANIATTVSARTGNVVAWESEVITPPPKGSPLLGTPAGNAPLADPAYPVAGVAVTLGAPSAGTFWTWPDGLAGNGTDEQYVIYNPGPQTADVRLSVDLEHGSAEPFELSVAPYQFVQEISEQQTSIPAGMPHTAAVVSTNGVPVVAARTTGALNSTAGGTGTRNGIGLMLGERLAAPSWIVPYASADAQHQFSIIVSNLGSAAVKVAVQSLPARPVTTPGFYTTTVAPGARVALPGLPTGWNAPLAIAASGPVYVETDIYGAGGTSGYSLSSAIPLS